MNIDYSLFPNTDGNLGKTKVKIPDGTTVTWPDGDALVGHFIYKNGELCGFVDTGALIANDSKTTTFPYDYVNIKLDKSLEGTMTFNKGTRTKYLTVTYFVDNRPEETIITIRFEDMDEETKTFLRSATKIIDNTLYDAEDNVIGTFDTRTLATGSNITKLDFNNLTFETTDGKDPDALFLGFYGEALESFNSDLSSLTNGCAMFLYQQTLESFNSNLSSLTNGEFMFGYCNLSSDSINNIASTINNLTPIENKNGIVPNIDIGTISNFSEINDALNTMMNKGWKVYSNGVRFSGPLGLNYKYDNCTHYTQIQQVDTDYITNDIVDGVWTQCLDDLEIGGSMNSNSGSMNSMFFNCPTLTTFNTELPSLIDGTFMFMASGINSFNINLSSLTNGMGMFCYCPNLVSFNSDLSSLQTGYAMFSQCNLDSESICNIANTINDINDLDVSNVTIVEGVPEELIKSIDLGTIPKTQEVALAIEQIQRKGWNVYSNFSEYTGNLGQDYKYDNCKTVSHITTVDSNYKTNDIIDGTWNERLDDLRDGSSMFKNCSTLTTFNSDLISLTYGDQMFYGCSNLTTFDSDLSSLTDGDYMFYGCSSLPQFDCESLSSVTTSKRMFYNCSSLTTFTSDLSSLTSGEYMFYNCSALSSFTSDLGSLTSGDYMFYNCSALTDFDSDFGSITDGYRMFYGCSSLSSFNSNLGSLTDGRYMFYNCSSLTSVDVDLSSLTEGDYMFYNCKLNETSIQNIANTIKSMSDEQSSPIIDLGTLSLSESNKNAVRQIRSKGWVVKCNGSEYLDNLGQDYKYDNCQTVSHVKMIDADYLTNDVVDGIWTERLDDLKDGVSMFYNCSSLSSFDTNLSSLTTGRNMFYNCDNLKTFNVDLSSLIDGQYMFQSCDNLTTFDSNLSSLTTGTYMFQRCSSLTTFNSDLSSLKSFSGMFDYCSSLKYFSADMKSLTTADEMFYKFSALTTFESDLSSLTEARYMFGYCTNLASFKSNLSSIAYGTSMFEGCTNLTTFDADLSSLTHGNYMFYKCNFTTFNNNLSSVMYANSMFSNCPKLTTFKADLSSLTYGFHMFSYNSKLATFDSDLSSLTNGFHMFYNCKLNTSSVQKIANTIKDVKSLTNSGVTDHVYKSIHIGIANSTPNTEEKAAFDTMVSKGWTVYVNGYSSYTPSSTSSSMTLDDFNEEQTSTPIPYYARPVEVTEEEAEYISEDGKFYCIVGAQFIYGDDISTYGMFTCEEDAAANMRLTKYEKPETKSPSVEKEIEIFDTPEETEQTTTQEESELTDEQIVEEIDEELPIEETNPVLKLQSILKSKITPVDRKTKLLKLLKRRQSQQ